MKNVFLLILIMVGFTLFQGCNKDKGNESMTSSSSEKNENSIKCSLTVEQKDKTVEAVVRVLNVSSDVQKIARYDLPVDGVITKTLFEIFKDGVKVTYKGALVKRAAPTEADFIKIEPGKFVETKFSLGEHYDFSTSGTYSIKYEVLEIVPQITAAGWITSNVVTLKID
jgi:peptidyl-Lys metalloendopeptidase